MGRAGRVEGEQQLTVVLAAMPRELRLLVRTLRLRTTALHDLPAWRGGGVLAAAVGVGPSLAGAAAARVLDSVGAARVLVMGVAGGVDPTLGVGDVVRPTAVVDARTSERFVPHEPSPETAAARAGDLVTVARALSAGAHLGAGLPEGTAAVDMETAAIAAVAEARGVPWDVLRGISDTGQGLTPQIAALLRPDGRTDLGAAARLVLRSPRSVAGLLRLGVDSARAMRTTTRAVLEELGAERSGGEGGF